MNKILENRPEGRAEENEHPDLKRIREIDEQLAMYTNVIREEQETVKGKKITKEVTWPNSKEAAPINKEREEILAKHEDDSIFMLLYAAYLARKEGEETGRLQRYKEANEAYNEKLQQEESKKPKKPPFIDDEPMMF